MEYLARQVSDGLFVQKGGASAIQPGHAHKGTPNIEMRSWRRLTVRIQEGPRIADPEVFLVRKKRGEDAACSRPRHRPSPW